MDPPAASANGSFPRSYRKPLQPKNSPAVEPRVWNTLKVKAASRSFQIAYPARGNADADDKENQLPGSVVQALAAVIAPLDTSLAEELGVVRRKRERLRAEREKTEKMLAERGNLLDRAMREVERRWEEQSLVELEIKRLIRLQEIGDGLSVLRPSPVKSLREREEEKKKEAQSQVCVQESSHLQPPGEGAEEKLKDDAQCQLTEDEQKERVLETSVSGGEERCRQQPEKEKTLSSRKA